MEKEQLSDKNNKEVAYIKDSNNLELFLYSLEKQIDLSSSVLKTIKACSFKNVKNVEHIKFPQTLERIEENAFENCQDLKSVIFDDENEKLVIESDAFKDCSSLDYVYLKSKNITIEKDAFSGCFNLRAVVLVVLKDGSIKIRKNAFSSSDLTIFVKENPNSPSSVESYCTTNNITYKEIQ